MSTDAASKFLDQLITNPELRGKFRTDPEGTMIQAGLDETQRKALSADKWNELGDDELVQRVSKTIRHI